MTKPDARKTILIVDDNLGFVFWLGETLAEAGYRVLPAKNARDARKLLSELKVAVDLLIVNPTTSGSGDLIETLRRPERQLRIVAITEATEQSGAAPLPSVDAFVGRPTEAGGVSKETWLRTVRRVLGDDPVGADPGCTVSSA